MDEKQIEFGVVAKDIVSGFEGLVTAKSQYWTGCDRVELTPTGLTAEGRIQASEWFDLLTVRVTGEPGIQLYYQPELEAGGPPVRGDAPRTRS